MSTRITAERYNQVQDRVGQILGNGSGTSGYGQLVSSNPVQAQVNKVAATDMNNLVTDMSKIRRHQKGLDAEIEISEVIAKTDLVSENDADTLKGILQFENFVNLLEADRFDLDIDDQSSVIELDAESTTNQWNTTLTHEFRIQFSSANARRYFFNAGGKILLDPSLDTESSDAKSLTWSSMLDEAGTISFNHNETTTDANLPNATVFTSAIGNYDLTSSYSTVFSKTIGGTYADIDYTVQVRENSASEIDFRCLFRDDSESGFFVDEFVQGTTRNVVQALFADGPNVSVTPPTYTIISSL